MTEWQYEVGQSVLVGNEEGVVESRGININRIPVYLVHGVWWYESELSTPAAQQG